jgi:hypothetical protein
MRLVDIVLAGVLLGLIVGFVQMSRQGEAKANVAHEAHNGVSERITWLWSPALTRRHGAVH